MKKSLLKKKKYVHDLSLDNNTDIVKIPIDKNRVSQKIADRAIIKAKLEYQYRVSRLSMPIMNSQLVSALGSWIMMQIIYNDRQKKREYKKITDIKEINFYFENKQEGEDYILVAGEKPNAQAGEAILNRAWGKPKETVEATIEAGMSLKDMFLNRIRQAGEVQAKLLQENGETIAQEGENSDMSIPLEYSDTLADDYMPSFLVDNNNDDNARV